MECLPRSLRASTTSAASRESAETICRLKSLHKKLGLREQKQPRADPKELEISKFAPLVLTLTLTRPLCIVLEDVTRSNNLWTSRIVPLKLILFLVLILMN